MHSPWYRPAGSASRGVCEVEITPVSAGWTHTSLSVVALDPGGSHHFETSGEEVIVLPLSGAVTVDTSDESFALEGRVGVFSGPTDIAYVGISSAVTLTSAAGGRFAVCGATADRSLPTVRLAAADIPVELRGAGQSSRQVRNFGTPDALVAASLIACEVITPAGNWSSYPAHKHDETSADESELEEIYYFEIAAGPQGQPGFGFMRTSSSPDHDIDLLEEVHDRDTVLVPFGWHGPCVATPGHDMYYLNVMAGPGTERVWKISDHPEQTWIRGTWEQQAIDPRLGGA